MSHTKTVLVQDSATAAALGTDPTAGLSLAVNDVFTASSSWQAKAAGTKYQFASPGGSSLRFDGADIVSVTLQADRAATQQVDFINLADDPASSTDPVYVKIIDVTEGREKFSIATFEVEKGLSATARATAMVNAINASKRDVFKDIEATAADGSGSGEANVDGRIKITAPANKILRFAVNDASTVLDAAGTESSSVDPVAAVFSIGQPADVDKEVQDALPIQGVTNISGPNVVKPSYPSTAGKTFDRYCVFIKQTHGDRDDIHELVIYNEDGNSTATTNFATLFGL